MGREQDFDMYFSTSSVARKTGASLRQLYYWEKLCIIRPRLERFGKRLFRRYHQRDINLIHRIKGYLQDGYSLKAAAMKAKGMDTFSVRVDGDGNEGKNK